MKILTAVLATILISLIGFCLYALNERLNQFETALIELQSSYKQAVVFDLQNAVSDFIERSDLNIDDESGGFTRESQRALDEFRDDLNIKIMEFSDEHNFIVLTPQAVIAGAPEVQQ